MTKIFAHRGASAYAPENTLAAFDLAQRLGADGIELDVQFTKDGEVVVIHDETIDRTGTGKGHVRVHTLAELKKLSFHNRMEQYRGEQIPTLREVLDLVKDGDMEVNIELKTGIFWYPGIEEKTIEIVREAGMEDRVIYSSFNHYSIRKIRELSPAAETAYLFSDVILDVERYAKETGTDGLHPAVYHMDMSDHMDRYKDSGLKVRIWTVNDQRDMERFIKEGFEAVITNYPDIALDVRERLLRK